MAGVFLDSQGHLSPPNSIDFLSLVMSENELGMVGRLREGGKTDHTHYSVLYYFQLLVNYGFEGSDSSLRFLELQAHQ
jgi:hypothetical protein